MSSTPSRDKIFSCYPEVRRRGCVRLERSSRSRACEAFRGSVSEEEIEKLMRFYELGAANGGFEERHQVRAVRRARESGFFVPFRNGAADGVASRRPTHHRSRACFAAVLLLVEHVPDDEMLQSLRTALRDPQVLQTQVRRMLADPRSETSRPISRSNG